MVQLTECFSVLFCQCTLMNSENLPHNISFDVWDFFAVLASLRYPLIFVGQITAYKLMNIVCPFFVIF